MKKVAIFIFVVSVMWVSGLTKAQDIGTLGTDATYYGNKLPDSAHVYLFHQLNGDSILQYKEAFDYDEQGQLIYYQLKRYSDWGAISDIQVDSIGYDAAGNRNEMVYFRKENNGDQLLPISKVTSKYSMSNKLIERQNYLWEESIEGWFNFAQNYYIYNANDFLIKEEEWYTPLVSEALRLNAQKLFTYDEQGNNTVAITRRYNQQLGIDTLYAKDMHAFDEQQRMVQKNTYLWDITTGEWDARNQYVWAYEQEGYDQIKTEYTWRDDEWMPVSKIFEQFDSLEKTFTTRQEDWNRNEEQWNPDKQYIEIYQDDFVRPVLIQEFDYRDDQWVLLSENTIDYNVSGQEIQYQNRVFDAWISSDSLITLFKRRTLYDENGWATDVFIDKRDDFIGTLQAQSHYQITYDKDYNKQIEHWNTWYLFEQQYLPSNKRYYYYPSYITGVDVPTERFNPIRLYPQPTTNLLLVEIPIPLDNGYYRIYNLEGMEILNGQLGVSQTKVKIPVESLPVGTYLLQLINNQQLIDVKTFMRIKD